MELTELTLQEKIDLVLYKDIDNLLKAEIYFKGRLTPYCTVDCNELLEELLKVKLTITKKNDDYGDFLIEVNGFIFDKANWFFYLKIGKILSEVFVKEEFYDYDNYNPLSLNHFLNLCENADVTINEDSYNKFLLAFEIQEKNYRVSERRNLSEIEAERLGQIGIGLIETQNQEEYFMKLISTNQNRYELAYIYEDCQFTDFLFIVLRFVLKNKYILRRCQYCKNWFVANKSDEKYCKRNIPIINNINGHLIIEGFVTCQEKAQKEKRKQRENGNKLLKLENNVRTKLAKRIQAKTINEDEIKKRQEYYLRFLNDKEKLKEKLKNEEISQEEYIKWLKSF